MNKLVYLFELDSVRNTDEQMELAMKALFREILINGNAVVITFNQLIDSRFFLSLMNDDKWSDCVTKLFQMGAIRISQFGMYRTPSQYLIGQALDSDQEYIYSGLPLKSRQKALIALTKRSLMYSDLTELGEYISRKRDDTELRKLFREVEKDEDGNVISIRETFPTSEEVNNTLHDLQAVLKLILQLSDIQNAYVPPKRYNRKAERLTLYDYLECVRSFDIPEIVDLKRFPEWRHSINLLFNKILPILSVDKQDKRSEILILIYRRYRKMENSPYHSSEVNSFFQRITEFFYLKIIGLHYAFGCCSKINSIFRTIADFFHRSFTGFYRIASRCFKINSIFRTIADFFHRSFTSFYRIISRYSKINSIFRTIADFFHRSFTGFYRIIGRCSKINSIFRIIIDFCYRMISDFLYVFTGPFVKVSKVVKIPCKMFKSSLYAYAKLEKRKRTYALAEAIVDLCYNYTCEASICNASRHYNIEDYKTNRKNCKSFTTDFLSQLKRYYGVNIFGKKYFFRDREYNDFKPYFFKKPVFFSLERAVHLSEHAEIYTRKDEAVKEFLPTYEYELVQQRWKQKITVIGYVLLRFILAVLIGVMIYYFGCLLEALTRWAFFRFNPFLCFKRTLFDSWINDSLIEKVFFFFSSFFLSAHGFHFVLQKVSNKTSNLISQGTFRWVLRFVSRGKSNDFSSLFIETMEGFVSLFSDFICVLCSWRNPYYNKHKDSSLTTDLENAIYCVNYVPKNILDYMKYKKEKANRWMFNNSGAAPSLSIFGVNGMLPDEEVQVRLARIEELTGKEYGIAYSSSYHKMIVDPLEKKQNPSDNDIYPYERLTPASEKSGVVTVPIKKGMDGITRFVLIKQYRHAIRREQLCFPRGFGEKDITSKLVLSATDESVFNELSGEDKEEMVDFYNAQKELHEEIGAVLLGSNETGKSPQQIKCVTKAEQEKNPSVSLDVTDNPKPALTTLGKITPDSGSLCDTVRVIQANLDSYQEQNGHEGIIGNEDPLTADQLEDRINNGEIDDGFTIAAFLLWKLKN